MKKKLIIYFIIIAIILVLIMFILPDDIFLKKYENIVLPQGSSETTKKEFLEYEIQKENLINNKYSFEYTILDSMSSQSYQYKCNGTKDNLKYSGTCTGSQNFTFNEENISDNFKIDTTYLELNKIFDLIKENEPTLSSERESREYLYNVQIDNLETEIIIYTDLYDINKIEISNAYMVYILKYKSIA